MGLEKTTVKHLLLLLNFILTVLACILIGFGIFILVSGAANRVNHGENVAGILIIVLGIIILIISIFGCLAAIHEARKRLLIFIVALCVLILLQLLMSAMASHGTRDGLAGSVREGFDYLWELEQTEPGALAYYEDWLHCCGVNNTDDYHQIQHDIPKTCCINHNCRVVTNIYTSGCQEKFEEYLYAKMVTFNIVSWLLIILEVMAVTFAWMLFSSLKNESRRSNNGWM